MRETMTMGREDDQLDYSSGGSCWEEPSVEDAVDDGVHFLLEREQRESVDTDAGGDWKLEDQRWLS
jgi:hypothetical protein